MAVWNIENNNKESKLDKCLHTYLAKIIACITFLSGKIYNRYIPMYFIDEMSKEMLHIKIANKDKIYNLRSAL